MHTMTYQKEIQFIVLVIKALSLFTFINSTNSAKNTDAEILLHVKQHQLEDPLKHLDDWRNSTKPCNWTGIICDARTNDVVNISLASLNISGPFPSGLCRIPTLRNLDLGYNNFGGQINPASISICSRLVSLNLSVNNFVGALPDFPARHFLNLTILDLTSNYFSGEIPVSLAYLNRLRFLSIAANMLNGSIPEFLFNLTEITHLIISDNPYRPSHLPRNIGRLTKLEELWLSHSNLVGDIPDSIGNLVSIKNFDVAHNSLTIPASIGRMINAVQIELWENQLSGDLPDTFANLTSLLRFDASSNKLTGKIPLSLAGLAVEALALYDNFLEGEIPEIVARNNALQVLKLFKNSLSGTLPMSLGLNSDLEHIDVSTNNLSGEILKNVTGFGELAQLDLSKNQISGVIPYELGSLTMLTYLNISNNILFGEIPQDLTKLKLTVFDVSNNRLHGRVPDGFDSVSFLPGLLGNAGLCSTSNLKPIQPCSDGPKRAQKKSHLLVGVLSALGLIPIALLVLVVLKTKKLIFFGRKSTQTWKVTAFQRVPLEEEDVLTSLSAENLIGSGGSGCVYKVVLKSGQIVAAKKLWEVKGAEGAFRAEVETMGGIRHVNIVKLLFTCMSEDYRILVYEYMENGSLGDVLHDREEGGLADWPKRLAIAVGTAQGLAYLHHDCVPAVMHRDLKSNNILLDGELGAKVADFGLAKMLKRDVTNDQVMSRVAGSYGYIAPEYGYTMKVTEKSDVYSFGIVLLELLTGKRPNDSFFGENTNIVKWVEDITLPYLKQGRRNGDSADIRNIDSLNQILDTRMDADTIEYSEVRKVLNVALLCTVESPRRRPSMRRVVDLLKKR